MPEQALYLKWRPLSFDDVVGQEHVVRTLRNALKTGRVRHAYLFSGPRGTGKTTTARLLAKAVNCRSENYDIRPCNECAACLAVNEGRYLDLIEIDAATHTGVDDVRDLREKIAFTPGEGQFKVYIIDEVHRFTGNAFDALLKTLEEPPDHAIFVLATTEIDKVPQTIKSRCLQFEFRRVSLNQVADRLQQIAHEEGLNIDRGALELIARQGTGSVRDSISLLDQIVSDPEEHINLETAQRILGTANNRAVREMVEALVMGNITRGLHVINEAIDAGSDPRQFAQQAVEHLRAILLAQTASADLVEASAEDAQMYTEQAGKIGRGALLLAIRLFNEAVSDFRGGWQPQLPLELALIEAIKGAEPEPITAPVQYIAAAPAGAKSAPAAEAEAEPAIEAMPPGAPPVVQTTAIVEKWNEMLRALHRYSSSGPAVVQHFRVQKVEGNTVYLCTDTAVYFDRLNGQAEKLQVVQRALRDVHGANLRVQVVLVDTFDAMGSGVHSEAMKSDPLLSLGLEQLGAELTDES